MILILYINNISINIWVKCSGSLFQTDTALYITVFFKAFVLSEGSVNLPIEACLAS